MIQNPVASPCVRNCCLDRNDICMGCGRHLDEIKIWQAASRDQRLEILVQAAKRLEQRKNLYPRNPINQDLIR